MPCASVANKCLIFDASDELQQVFTGSTSACTALSVKRRDETRELDKTS